MLTDKPSPLWWPQSTHYQTLSGMLLCATNMALIRFKHRDNARWPAVVAELRAEIDAIEAAHERWLKLPPCFVPINADIPPALPAVDDIKEAAE